MVKTNRISLTMEATSHDALPMDDTLQTLQGVQPEGTAPMEATQQNDSGRQRKGRRKIPMQRIVNDEDRLITFSKRRAGIYKKATEIGTLCGVEIGVLIFSPAGKPFAYGVPNIESMVDRFLWGTNPSQNENLSSIMMESQRTAHVGNLNRDYDELSVYLQNLKKEGDKLMEMKKQAFDDDCWWDIPLEDLKADEMEKLTAAMEEIKKNASKRLRDLKVGASSSTPTTIQPKVEQMRDDEGFGYGGASGYGNFIKGGSSTMVEGVQGGVLQTDGISGQGYKDVARGGGGLGDWRDGASIVVVEGIQGGGFQVDGNGGIGGTGGYSGGLGEWVADGAASSFVQAGATQMGGKGGDGYGKGVVGSSGDFTASVSSLANNHHGGVQIGENGGAGFVGGDVTSGGIGELKTIPSSASSLAIHPAGGFVQGDGNGSGFGSGVARGAGLGGGWRAVVLSSKSSAVLGANPIQMDGNGWFGNFGCNGGGGSGRGHGDWKEFRSFPMQMGGNGWLGYSGYVGASGGLRGASSSSSSLQPNPMQMGGNGGFPYASIGGGTGGGGFSDFATGGLSSSAHDPDQMQMGSTGNGGSFSDAGDEFGNNGLGTNNGFRGFFHEGSGGF